MPNSGWSYHVLQPNDVFDNRGTPQYYFLFNQTVRLSLMCTNAIHGTSWDLQDHFDLSSLKWIISNWGHRINMNSYHNPFGCLKMIYCTHQMAILMEILGIGYTQISDWPIYEGDFIWPHPTSPPEKIWVPHLWNDPLRLFPPKHHLSAIYGHDFCLQSNIHCRVSCRDIHLLIATSNTQWVLAFGLKWVQSVKCQRHISIMSMSLVSPIFVMSQVYGNFS